MQGEHRVTLVDAIKLIGQFKGEVLVHTQLHPGHEGTWIRAVKSDLMAQLKYSAEMEMAEDNTYRTRITLDVVREWDRKHTYNAGKLSI